VRGGEQPAVGGDELEGAVVVEAEVVAAQGGAVEQPQPHPLGRHLLDRADRAVDHERLAHDAAGHRGLHGELAVHREGVVLDDDGDVVDAVLARQAGGVRGGVVEDEHADIPR